MNSPAQADREVIRNAGKATTVLQALAVVLIGILASIYIDISHRYSALQDGVRENAMWSVYQLDREARVVKETLGDIIAQKVYTQEKLNFLALSFNILYSRMTTLEQSHFESKFSVDQNVLTLASDIRRTVYSETPLFDDIEAGKDISLASLSNLNYELGVLVRKSGDLLVYTNNTLSSDRADERSEILYLEKKSLILISVLVLSVVILVVMLRRQLKSVRAAGLSFEKMAERVNDAYEAAEAGNRAKSQFMATMGHEIRTPLNAILGMVEVLELSALPSDVENGIRTIQRSGEALLDIINEILDFSKIEHGNLELERRPVDVRMLAEGAVEIMRGRASESGNEVRLDIPDVFAVPAIMSDPTRIRQVILNLMSNALKFTSNGAVTLRLRETTEREVVLLRVEVEDTGIGIDEAGLQKLFQPFSQVDATITRKYGGTGLGLTICKQIVGRLDGKVGVTSAPGQGSTFWFEIPVEPAQANLGSPAQPSAKELPALCVLLVEDNVVNQQVASRLLEHLGQSVKVVGDGSQAVAITATEHFDVILMDMQMPVMDGIEATLRIRRRGDASASTPIVAMTANASEEDRRRCEAAGMTGFRSKPISLAMLRSLLSDPALIAGSQRNRASPPPAITATKTDHFDQRRTEIVEALGEDTFQELLITFFDDASVLLRGLYDALGNGEQANVDKLLHTLKGAAASVGLSDIADVSQRLRIAGPTVGNIDDLTTAIHKIKRSMAA